MLNQMWFEGFLPIGIALICCSGQAAFGLSEICQQDPFLKGGCFENEIRWSFNQQWETCTPFVFGGCKGNENNFRSKGQCVSACIENTEEQSEKASGRTFDFESSPKNIEAYSNKEVLDYDDVQQNSQELLPQVKPPMRCLEAMVHKASTRKTKNCKLENINEMRKRSRSRRGWTYDPDANVCLSRPFLESACAKTKNKFIEKAECIRVCERGNNKKKATDPDQDSSFWQNIEKHAHRNNYKIRKELSDWTASCSDHPVWVVNKLRSNWVSTLSRYDSTQVGYSFCQRKRQCVKVKDIVKSPTLNKFFTKSECEKCKVVELIKKRTCLAEPKIAPDGFCSSQVVEDDEEEAQVEEELDEEEQRRRRRRRRRRDELLLSRKTSESHRDIRWSFFDGSCVKYAADKCVHSKNAFKTSQECNKRCNYPKERLSSQELSLITNRHKLFKNVYFYQPYQKNLRGIFFFYLPTHYNIMDIIDVNRAFKNSKRRRTSAKRRSELDNESESLVAEGRASLPLAIDKDPENQDSVDLKGNRESEDKEKKPNTSTKESPADEYSPVIEVATTKTTTMSSTLTTRTTRSTTKKISIQKGPTSKPKYVRNPPKTTKSNEMIDKTAKKEMLPSAQNARCSQPPPPFGMCKKLFSAWTFLNSKCEFILHNMCSFNKDTDNIFKSEKDCKKACLNMETYGEKAGIKPNSPVSEKNSLKSEMDPKCSVPPTTAILCKTLKEAQVKKSKPSGRLSLVRDFENPNGQYSSYETNYKYEDYIKSKLMLLKDEEERKLNLRVEHKQAERLGDNSRESVEGRLGMSEEDVGRYRSIDDEDRDIPSGRSASDGDDKIPGNDDVLESEMAGRSWMDDLPEGQVAEDGSEVLSRNKRKVEKTEEDETSPDIEDDLDKDGEKKSTRSQGIDYADENSDKRSSDGDDNDQEDEKQKSRSEDSQESKRRRKRDTLNTKSGYVFQNGGCEKITLEKGECFKVTKNFFQSFKECDRACSRS